MHALRDRDAGRVLRDHRGGKRGGLAAALEAGLAGRTPGDHASARVGDRHLRVVERGTDERDARRDRLAGLGLLRGGITLGGGRVGDRRFRRGGRLFLLDVFFAHGLSLLTSSPARLRG